MSGGGRYIPAGGFASPVIEKAGLVERRGVRGPVLRRDTAEAGELAESSPCVQLELNFIDDIVFASLSRERSGDSQS